MTLQRAGTLEFDDILYMGIIEYLDKPNSLPFNLQLTDRKFLEDTFDLYRSITAEETKFFKHPPKTGFTTALCFITSYLCLRNTDITMLGRPGATMETFQNVNLLFNRFMNLQTHQDVYQNAIKISVGDEVFSTVHFLNDVSFDKNMLKGPIFFDNCSKLKNVEKFSLILKDTQKYDIRLLNFPDNKEIDKLARDFNQTIKEIKIL